MKKIILGFLLCVVCILLIGVSVMFIGEKLQDYKLNQEIFTLEEAAEYMKIPKKELLYLIDYCDADIFHIKIKNKSNTYYSFSKEAIDKWLLEHTLKVAHPDY